MDVIDGTSTNRLSNRAIAQQAATFSGLVIMLTSLFSAIPGIVFATGFSTVFLGTAVSCYSSFQDISRGKRLPHLVAGTVVESVLVVMVCYVVWDYTGTHALFVAAVASTGAIYCAVYWIVLHQLLAHRQEPHEPTEPE